MRPEPPVAPTRPVRASGHTTRRRKQMYMTFAAGSNPISMCEPTKHFGRKRCGVACGGQAPVRAELVVLIACRAILLLRLLQLCAALLLYRYVLHYAAF